MILKFLVAAACVAIIAAVTLFFARDSETQSQAAMQKSCASYRSLLQSLEAANEIGAEMDHARNQVTSCEAAGF